MLRKIDQSFGAQPVERQFVPCDFSALRNARAENVKIAYTEAIPSSRRRVSGKGAALARRRWRVSVREASCASAACKNRRRAIVFGRTGRRGPCARDGRVGLGRQEIPGPRALISLALRGAKFV